MKPFFLQCNKRTSATICSEEVNQNINGIESIWEGNTYNRKRKVGQDQEQDNKHNVTRQGKLRAARAAAGEKG